MADITLVYEFPIPDEQFLEGFDEGKMGSFTYNGPEVLVVTVPSDGSAYTQKLDGSVYDGEITVEIDLAAHPELAAHASLLWGRPYDFVATFSEVTLPDGTVYQDQNNKDIHDYYFPPRYNLTDGTWTDPFLVIKDALSPKMRAFISKAQMFIEILEMFELDTTSLTSLASFKTGVIEYSQKVATPWKYPGQNPFDIEAPKIPMGLVAQLAAAKDLLGEEDLKKLAAF